MSDQTIYALDSIDRFIAVATVANFPLLQMPEYQGAASDLYEISQKLLVANENMSRWLNRFLLFDFRDPNARSHFLDLVTQYRTAKAGPEFRNMKFSCGDIYTIFHRRMATALTAMYPDEGEVADEIRHVFTDLSNADRDMVAFIYDTVVGGIDRFVRDAEADVDRADLNGAETRRLQFKVESAALSERLEHFASGLSDLVLQYAQLAQRPVTLD
jgi:hypothetical protein